MDPASAQVLSLHLLPRFLRHAQRNGWPAPQPVTQQALAQFQLAVAMLVITAPVGSGAQPTTARRNNIPRPEPTIFATLRSLDKQMNMYENQELLDLAREAIPIQRLKAEATALQQSDSPLPCEEDALAQVLVEWFKKEYFKWADPIKCPKCVSKTQMAGMAQPSEYERGGGAGRVEVHVCSNENGPCDGSFRFPRYKRHTKPASILSKRSQVLDEDPFGTVWRMGKLVHPLSTRSRAPRTLRSVNPIIQSPHLPLYLAHILMTFVAPVWNAEDHVWNEYFSPAAGRWLHTDSCEAARDQPLLYDRGWGKKMSYIVAFSVDGAADVSRGYVQDSAEMFKRRRQAPEGALAQELAAITAARRRNFSETKKAQLEAEDATERAWLAASDERAKEPERAKEEPGRISGPQEWKEARGEAGSVPSPSSDDASKPN
ncbi:peptide-N4-(N-acetyl-beta- glucosaminyl)asparagine amidase [Ceratobasidium sp. 392]|nr:peptide-N4-(N-acetyl-beta- glucosaminyl)asparagine amidase [Ceratobasidium sp. 392]